MGETGNDIEQLEKIKEALRAQIVEVMVLKNLLIQALEGLSDVINRRKGRGL